MEKYFLDSAKHEREVEFLTFQQVKMANKPGPVGIAWTHPRFDGESPYWLGMGMSMGNPQLFQLGVGMGMGMYISLP